MAAWSKKKSVGKELIKPRCPAQFVEWLFTSTNLGYNMIIFDAAASVKLKKGFNKCKI